MRRYLVSLVAGLVVLSIMAWSIITFAKYPEFKDLPLYTLSTISRIVITLIISVVWGVSFGILAATNKVASLVLTPFIDLLQSIPILGYFPMVIGFLFLLGPFGIELSVIVLLFTSMAWAVFFGVLGAISAIPTNIVESSKSFRLSGWRYIRHVVLPAISRRMLRPLHCIAGRCRRGSWARVRAAPAGRDSTPQRLDQELHHPPRLVTSAALS